MADQEESLIDAAVDRLLRRKPVLSDGTLSYTRQQDDLERIQKLDVDTTQGDTFVIVRFPAGDFVNCHDEKWETKTFLMVSEDLRATGSSVFAKLLAPDAQAQARRRVLRHATPPTEAKFVLDLTPQIEGDELVNQVAQLSISDGVRDWWRSRNFLGASGYLVGGHDDNCPDHDELVSIPTGYTYRPGCNRGAPVDIDRITYPSPRKILDYCPIRHRAAILRLLMGIRHEDFVLDSAPRVATMAVIAKIFDCAAVVRDPVMAWFMAEPNDGFIDVNPEDTLKIAWTLELPAITRVAFRVLVVERAIEILGETQEKQTAQTNGGLESIFQRPRGSITEEQAACIQRAAEKLARRASDTIDGLKSNNASHHLGIINQVHHDAAETARRQAYIHEIVDKAMVENPAVYWVIARDERNRARYVSTEKLVPMSDIYRDMLPAQRILTVYFWYSAANIAYIDGISNTPPQAVSQIGDGPHHAQERLPDIPLTFRAEVSNAIKKFKNEWVCPDLEVPMQESIPMILSLKNDELQFLPAWAGGLGDGAEAGQSTAENDPRAGTVAVPEERSLAATSSQMTGVEDRTARLSLTTDDDSDDEIMQDYYIV
ncbi:hypothetical protein F4861DRAFT_245204 [Xylaria intraflava]|nr:hypothetical protein F4861DRAFT_245204 [Xylaria intraflava]